MHKEHLLTKAAITHDSDSYRGDVLVNYRGWEWV